MLLPERTRVPAPAFVTPPLLTIAEMDKSLEAAPSAIVKVRVDPPKSKLPLMVEEEASELVVTSPPKARVPEPVAMAEPVRFRVPVRVRLLLFVFKEAPVVMVKLLIVRVESKMGSLVTLGIRILSEVPGTEPRSQLPPTFQAVEVVPVQV